MFVFEKRAAKGLLFLVFACSLIVLTPLFEGIVGAFLSVLSIEILGKENQVPDLTKLVGRSIALCGIFYLNRKVGFLNVYFKRNISTNYITLLVASMALGSLYFLTTFLFVKEIDDYLYQRSLNVFFFLRVVLVGPILEEFLFRGIIFNTFYERYSLFLSTFATSLLFAIYHNSAVQLIGTFILSFYFCFLQYKFRSIIAPILAHIIISLLIFLFWIINLNLKGFPVLHLEMLWFMFFISLVFLVFTLNKLYKL